MARAYRTVVQEVAAGDGSRDISYPDSADVADQLAGTLGPVQTQDSIATSDSDVSLTLSNYVDMLDSDDAAMLTGDLAQADSADLTDALAGTLGPVQTQDSAIPLDVLGIGPLVVQDSIGSDDTVSLVDLVANKSDSVQSDDVGVVYLLTSVEDDSVAVADVAQFSDVSLPDSSATSDLRGEASVDATYWAGAVVTATNFDSSGNAVDTDTGTSADMTVEQSGGLGGGSQSESGTLVISFNDLDLDPTPTLIDVELQWGWDTTDSGNVLQSDQAVDVDIEYSVNDGSSWTALETITTPVATGDNTLDITGISYAQLQQLRFRATGTVTSGSIAIVGGATQTFSFRYGRVALSLTQSL